MANEGKKKVSTVKLVLFGIATFVIISIGCFWFMLWPRLQLALFPEQWTKDFNHGQEIFFDDRVQGERLIKSAIADAAQRKAPLEQRMKMSRQYASLLYRFDDWNLGDQQIQYVIDIAPKEPASDMEEAGILTLAYQDRAWETHQRFLKNGNGASGDKDQEMSLALAQKIFGPEHKDAVDKMPTLALIYIDMGLKDKGHEVMQKAIQIADSKPSAVESRWWVYTMDARAKAVEHDYSAALKSFLRAADLASKDDDRERSFTEFSAGLKQGRKDSVPELESVPNLFAKSKFAELDRMADQLRKEVIPNYEACCRLDYFYMNLLGKDTTISDSGYKHKIFQFQKWMKERPQSATARVGLAECYANYAWFARGGGWADSVSEDGWKQFGSRIDLAKSILDADKSITTKCPRASREYSTVALAQGWDKPRYMRVIDGCHRLWPTYYNIDNSAVYYFLPRWHGAEGESEKYLLARADSVGGARGDELMAEVASFQQKYLDNLFSPDSPIKWARLKAGFKQVLAQFPDDINARINYIYFALREHDLKSLDSAFDGFKGK